MLKNRITLKYFNDYTNDNKKNLFNTQQYTNTSRINKKLFFNHNDVHYNTKEQNLSSILEIMALELQIIDVTYLQPQKKNNFVNVREKVVKERLKLRILEQAKYLGEILIKENQDIFINKKAPELGDLLKRNFYILREKTDKFINVILVPLLKLIDNAVYYEWERLDNKSGFWRELKDQESVPVGSEVSMNFETGKNMLKL